MRRHILAFVFLASALATHSGATAAAAATESADAVTASTTDGTKSSSVPGWNGPPTCC